MGDGSMRFRKCVVALLVLCLLAAIPALAEGLEIEEEPILPESEEIDFTDDSIVGEDIDNTVEEEDFMLSHDEPHDHRQVQLQLPALLQRRRQRCADDRVVVRGHLRAAGPGA